MSDFKKRRGGHGLPRSLAVGRIIAHNVVRHADDMPHGVNGFRWWSADAPAPGGWVRCKCGWSGLPHYRMSARVICKRIGAKPTATKLKRINAAHDRCHPDVYPTIKLPPGMSLAQFLRALKAHNAKSRAG